MRFKDYLRIRMDIFLSNMGEDETKRTIKSSGIRLRDLRDHLNGTRFPTKRNFAKYYRVFFQPKSYDAALSKIDERICYEHFRFEEEKVRKGVNHEN